MGTIIIVEILEILVGAAGAALEHEGIGGLGPIVAICRRCRNRERDDYVRRHCALVQIESKRNINLQDTSIVIIRSRIVGVGILHVTNGQCSLGGQTPIHDRFGQSTNLAHDIVGLDIGHGVQYPDGRSSGGVIGIGLSGHLRAGIVDSGDGLVFGDVGSGRGGESNFRVGLGVSALLVDLACGLETFVGIRCELC